jgi:hypothetical protein
MGSSLTGNSGETNQLLERAAQGDLQGLGALLERHRKRLSRMPASPTPDPALPKPEDPGPLRAAHTPNFPALLRQLGASLLVTTYQAGKLVMVRDKGDHLNTHYRAFQSPMGLALAGGGARLAIGTTIQVWEFRDVPDVARRLEPAGTHDACFLRRSSHVTGTVLIHEIAYGVRGQESGGRSRAVVRQYPVLLPGHARPRVELCAAVPRPD